MGEWKPYKLTEVAIDFAMGPFGSNIKAENFIESGVPVIRGSNLNFYKYVDGDFVYLSDEKADELTRSNCYPGDLVFTHRGTIGQVGLVPERKYPRYVISQSGMKLTVDENKLDKHYLFYFFKSPIGQHELLKNESQVGVPSISSPLSSLKSVDLTLPPLPEQKAIASVLSSLDDKIDLLRRQNKTLETMAETLFRQWFVEEAAEDWEDGTLGDVVTVKGGTTPSTKEPDYWNGDIYWTAPHDLSNHTSVFLFNTERKITKKGLAQISSGLLPIGTVLLSSRAPIGYLAITDIHVAINQGYIGIICDKVVSNYFIYLWCKVNIEEIENSGNGSVFQEISKSAFKSLSISIPPQSLLDTFNQEIGYFFDKIRENQKQIRILEKLRDTLIPKLMSGEVGVNY